MLPIDRTILPVVTGGGWPFTLLNISITYLPAGKQVQGYIKLREYYGVISKIVY